MKRDVTICDHCGGVVDSLQKCPELTVTTPNKIDPYYCMPTRFDLCAKCKIELAIWLGVGETKAAENRGKK